MTVVKYKNISTQEMVEAQRFDGSDKSVDWLLPQLISGKIGRSYNKLHMKTLDGVKQANVGDYIVKNTKGEFHPCEFVVFEKTYKRIK